jgi:hypothetical protein
MGGFGAYNMGVLVSMGEFDACNLWGFGSMGGFGAYTSLVGRFRSTLRWPAWRKEETAVHFCVDAVVP